MRAAPPTSARSAAIMIGDVWCKAESVTGYTTPAATIDTARITATGSGPTLSPLLAAMQHGYHRFASAATEGV